MSSYATSGRGGSAYARPAAGGSAYAGGTSSRAAKKKPHGVSGFVHNLGNDISGAILGLPEGLKTVGAAIVDEAQHGPSLLDMARGKGSPFDDKDSPFYRGVVHPVLQQEAAAYGPLLHGDFSGLYNHPLTPILDALTVATVGAGTAARVAGRVAPESRLARYVEPRQIEYATPATRAGDAGASAVKGKALSRNPLIRKRQETLNALANKVPYDTRLVGEGARATRAQVRGANVDRLGFRQQAAAYNAAVAKLDKYERKALYPLSVLPLPRSLENWRALLHEADQAAADERARIDTFAKTGGGGAYRDQVVNPGRLAELDQTREQIRRVLDTLDDPNVRAAYQNPSPALLAARDAAGRLGGTMAAKAAEQGTMTASDAAQAAWRQTRLADGAAVYTAAQARQAIRSIDGQLKKLGKTQEQVQKLATGLRETGTPELRQLRRDITKSEGRAYQARTNRARLDDASAKVDKLHNDLATARGNLETAMGAGTAGAADSRYLGSLLGKVRHLSDQYDRSLANLSRSANRELDTGDLTQARSEAAAAHAAIRSDIASRLVAGRVELGRIAQTMDELAARRGEIRPGIVGGDIEALKAELAAAGRPEPIYFPDIRHTPLDRPHVGAGAPLAVANPIHESNGLLFLTGQVAMDPAALNRQFLRVAAYTHYRDVIDRMLNVSVPVRGRELPAGHVWVKKPKQLGNITLDDARNVRLSESDLFDGDADHALLDHGQRYAIPAGMARRFGQEFVRSERASRLLVEKPLDVWRALVLNLSVGWLARNILGNHLMYAIQFAGMDGLRAYAHMILNAKGPATVRRMLNIPDPNGIGRELLAELLPEQAGGTFIDTQIPATGSGSRLMRVVTAPTRPLVKADREIEGGLRRAASEAAIRGTPEFKRLSRQLRSETRDFDTIARKALADPAVQREVSDKVNAALGNFLDLSPVERGKMRRLVPFYAWYKAISAVTLKLAFDTPGRADALSKIGQIGEDMLEEQFGGDLPSFLKGALLTGGASGGRVPLINLTGAVPQGTTVQLGKSIADLFAAQPGKAGNTVGSELNPFGQAAIQWLTGRSLFNGGVARPELVPGLPGYVVSSLLRGTPIGRVGERGISGSIESPLYGKRDLLSELLRSTGVAPTSVVASRARQLADQGS